MTRPLLSILVLTLLTGCATFSSLVDGTEDRLELWALAQQAMAREEFDRAEEVFTRITEEHPETVEGRESLFYLGAMRLDPRNPDWDSEVAEQWLSQYIDASDDGGARLYRYPEATTLQEIAHQLNLPPDSRIEGLQPEERVITIEERVLVPAEQSRELMEEIERLRALIAEREATIRAQQEELERIRRTLTGPGRSTDGGR